MYLIYSGLKYAKRRGFKRQNPVEVRFAAFAKNVEELDQLTRKSKDPVVTIVKVDDPFEVARLINLGVIADFERTLEKG